MKSFIILILIVGIPYLADAQSCEGGASPSCSATSCGPKGTKKAEAVVITTMRKDLQKVLGRISNLPTFTKEFPPLQIDPGATDDESLLILSQAVNSIRFEFLSRIEPARLIEDLRKYKPAGYTTKQQMVSSLKKEIQILVTQAEKL